MLMSACHMTDAICIGTHQCHAREGCSVCNARCACILRMQRLLQFFHYLCNCASQMHGHGYVLQACKDPLRTCTYVFVCMYMYISVRTRHSEAVLALNVQSSSTDAVLGSSGARTRFAYS